VHAAAPRRAARCRYGFPEKQARNKAVYFIKPEEGFLVTKENVTSLLKGDVTPSRVEGLNALVRDLLLPLFANDGNAQEW